MTPLTDQRLNALRKANKVRCARAALKHDLKRGTRTLKQALDDPSCQTAEIYSILRAVPGYGDIKTQKLLREAGVSPSRQISSLTERERRELLA